MHPDHLAFFPIKLSLPSWSRIALGGRFNPNAFRCRFRICGHPAIINLFTQDFFGPKVLSENLQLQLPKWHQQQKHIILDLKMISFIHGPFILFQFVIPVHGFWGPDAFTNVFGKLLQCWSGTWQVHEYQNSNTTIWPISECRSFWINKCKMFIFSLWVTAMSSDHILIDNWNTLLLFRLEVW